MTEPRIIPSTRAIDSDWHEQRAEGRRRWREYEQLTPITRDGVIVGFEGHRRQPDIASAAPHFNTDPMITLHTPTLADERDLARELQDLERDAELMAKHEGVRYERD